MQRLLNGWQMEKNSSGDYTQDSSPCVFPLAHDCCCRVKMNAGAFPVNVESQMQHLSCLDEADVHYFDRDQKVSFTAYMLHIFTHLVQ